MLVDLLCERLLDKPNVQFLQLEVYKRIFFKFLNINYGHRLFTGGGGTGEEGELCKGTRIKLIELFVKYLY